MSQYQPAYDYQYGQYTQGLPPPPQPQSQPQHYQSTYQAQAPPYQPVDGYTPSSNAHPPAGQQQHFQTMTSNSYDYNSNIPGLGMESAPPAPLVPTLVPSATYYGGPPHSAAPAADTQNPSRAMGGGGGVQYQDGYQQPPPPPQHQQQYPAHVYQPYSQVAEPSYSTQEQSEYQQPQQPQHSQQPQQQPQYPVPNPSVEDDVGELGDFDDLYEPHDPEKEERKLQLRVQEEKKKSGAKLRKEKKNRALDLKKGENRGEVTTGASTSRNWGQHHSFADSARPTTALMKIPGLDIVPNAPGHKQPPTGPSSTTPQHKKMLQPKNSQSKQGQVKPPKPKQPQAKQAAKQPPQPKQPPAKQTPLKPPQEAQSEAKQAARAKPPRPQTKPSQPDLPAPPVPAMPTIQDKKNKAKVAILALWDVQVRYQHFVDEGFDPTIIRGLFKEVGLDVGPTAKPGSQAPANSSSLPDPSSISSLPSRPSLPVAEAHSSAKPTTTAVSELARKPTLPAPFVDDKGESRKDKIARLLAQKKGNKTPTSGNQTSPDSVAKSLPAVERAEPVQPAPQAKMPAPEMPAPESAQTLAKAKTLSEKDILLQKKMDALEKSRAARKQKDAERRMSGQSQSHSRPSTAVAADTDAILLSSSSQVPVALVSGASAPGSLLPALPSIGAGNAKTAPSAPAVRPVIPSLSVPNAPTSRKRPVASDFDTTLPAPPPKRPFQPSYTYRASPVSDESMDEDVEMDIGSPIDPPSGPGRRPGPGFLPGLPVRADSYSSPAPGTPPIIANAIQGNLDRATRDIEALKKKIAQAEARKAAQTKQDTPPSSAPSQVQQAASQPEETKTIDDQASAQLIAECQPHVEQPEPLKVAMRSDAGTGDTGSVSGANGPVGASLLRVQRRDRIVSVKLPQLDNGVQEKMDRVKALEQELARLRSGIKDDLDEKNKLTEEVNQLDAESEGETEQGPSVNGVGSVAVEPVPENPVPEHIRQPSPSDEPTPMDLDQDDDNESDDDASTASSPMDLDEGNEDMDDAPERPPQPTEAPPSEHNSAAAPPSHTDPVDGVPDGVPTPIVNDLPPLGAAENFHPLPKKPTDAAACVDAAAGDDTAPGVDAPADVGAGTPCGRSPEPHASSAKDQSLGDEEARLEVESGSPIVADSPSPLQEVNTVITEQTIDHSQPNTTDSTAVVKLGDSPLFDQSTSELPQIISLGIGPTATEDVVPSGGTIQREVKTTTAAPPPMPKLGFVPYQSPLTMFKAYRFHPDFKQTVAGGLRSLTYSHHIDPNLEFCPSELLYKQCPDTSCKFQHMKEIVIPDDHILLELGDCAYMSEADKTKFIRGLKILLQEVKTRNVTDFDVIADEIIAYRAKFNGDPSKILPLGGVEI